MNYGVLLKLHTDNCVTEFRVERSIERRNFHSGRSMINNKDEELRWAVECACRVPRILSYFDHYTTSERELLSTSLDSRVRSMTVEIGSQNVDL